MRTLRLPGPGERPAAPAGRSAVVVGAGIAGLAAATVLAERGVRVTVVERERFLGGRAGSWADRLKDGTSFEMERGFHAFFRQYYNLRALLRRVDPGLSFLRRLEDYPILGPRGEVQSFSGLPRRTPYNLVQLVRRSSALSLRDLTRVDVKQALRMLTYDSARTYEQLDHQTAASYLDGLRFPPPARRLLFDVFAHSFFNPERDMSAAELLMMFHFYFTGNDEGLVFDVVDAPFSRRLWDPLRAYLEARKVRFRLGESVASVTRDGDGWSVHTKWDPVRADGVVLALPVAPLRQVVAASPDLDAPAWRRQIESLAPTLPFVVWRLWLDRPVTPGRAPFVGTTGLGLLDNISIFPSFEDESAAWAARTGGTVVELHAYAVPKETPESEVRRELWAGLHHLYPETVDAKVVEERYLWADDCPAFAPGSHASRPNVLTPFPQVALAGDFVRLPFPSALMERACASGFLAANTLLARDGVEPEPIHTVHERGLLARLAR